MKDLRRNRKPNSNQETKNKPVQKTAKEGKPDNRRIYLSIYYYCF